MEFLKTVVRSTVLTLWYLPIAVGCISLITRNAELLEQAAQESTQWMLIIYGVILWTALAMGEGLVRLIRR